MKKVLLFSMIAMAVLCLAVACDGPHEHIKGEPVRENEVGSTCTKLGSYDEACYCTICGEELERITYSVPLKAHDYGEGGKQFDNCQACGKSRFELDPIPIP